MEKTATLNLRVNPIVKERAEEVLSRLGVPMSTAIDMYLNQIFLTGGIPFAVTLPKAPDVIYAKVFDTDCLLRIPSVSYRLRKDRINGKTEKNLQRRRYVWQILCG